MSIPILDLKLSEDPDGRSLLLNQLRDAMFNIGFLYITNHGVQQETVSDLVKRLPDLFDLPNERKMELSKINSPHFLGYSGFAEETTQGKQDLREQFDFGTELPIIYEEQARTTSKSNGRDLSKLYWRLRGPNIWPSEVELPGFKTSVQNYHDSLSDLSFRFVHLVEEAFGIPVGTFDQLFKDPSTASSSSIELSKRPWSQENGFLHPQHRLKLLKYHATESDNGGQGVGAHKDSSGWLTFLYQVGDERGLEVLDKSDNWIPANPVPNSFVVNFGNAFEAATEGAVRATVHRVKAPTARDRYSIPFFMGLPLDLKVSEIRSFIPEKVRLMRREVDGKSAVEGEISDFLDLRWDCLGESVLRKWIRSHKDVALRWYGPQTLEYYTQ